MGCRPTVPILLALAVALCTAVSGQQDNAPAAEPVSLAAALPPSRAPGVEGGLLGPLGSIKSGRDGAGGVGFGAGTGTGTMPAAGGLGTDSNALPMAGGTGADTGMVPTAGGSGIGTGGVGGGGVAGGTPAAVGGSEYDLVGTLFNGNSQAFTQSFLVAGTSSSAIAISGMLQLQTPQTLRTLRESLASPEPGATAVSKAITGGWELAVCQNPEQNQDATAAAISGKDALAVAAASSLARAAGTCCSKVAGHLAGAALSLEAGPAFADDLLAALAGSMSQLPACAVPASFAG